VGTAVTGLLAMGAGSAMALPGDDGIKSSSPFRLNAHKLEPGCFSPRYVPSNIDLSSFDMDNLPDEELRISNRSGSSLFSYNIDQVLIPSKFGGYRVYDSFNRHGDDVAPGEQEGELFAPDANGNGNPDPIENDDVILCVSDETSEQNEPYQQQDGGLVSAKNRPVIQPKVTALGVSAIEPLNTYKIGFGYAVNSWYSVPTFDGHGLFPAVTDPEASAFGADGLPNVVRLRVRLDDLPYDARRVNDVDKAGESWTHGDSDDGQDVYLRRGGDDTAWTDSNGNGLLTTLTQGDLPIKWTLRPSLASPGSLKSVSWTDQQLRDWEASWQAFYEGGPKPTMPLAPGTNSPAPKTSVVVNLPESRPSSGAAQAPVSSSTNTTISVTNACVSNRKVKIAFSKRAKAGRVRFNGKTIKAKRIHGRLRATVSFRGMKAAPGSYAAVVMHSNVHGKWSSQTRMFKLC
jgi:hypothetical protein